MYALRATLLTVYLASWLPLSQRQVLLGVGNVCPSATVATGLEDAVWLMGLAVPAVEVCGVCDGGM